VKKAKLNEGHVTSWSPSRLEKFERCPRLMLWDTVEKLCPLCFQGKVMGGYDTPAICDTCGETIEDSAAFARGSEIGKNLELYVLGEESKLHEEIRHPVVKNIAKGLRAERKKDPNHVKVEFNIVMDKNWRLVSQFDKKNAWARIKLDVLQVWQPSWNVIDWKSGGIDKRTGEVRAEDKYDDQLSAYAAGVLAAFPAVPAVSPSLVFVDCGPRFDPVILKQDVQRKALPKLKEKWEKRVLPIFKEKKFMPRPGYYCKWCPYEKAKGGPCLY
jgi:hypothetical protein